MLRVEIRASRPSPRKAKDVASMVMDWYSAKIQRVHRPPSPPKTRDTFVEPVFPICIGFTFQMADRSEQLRKKMTENAAEINRLHDRIHDTYKWKCKGDKEYQEWSDACSEFHSRYDQLCLPGGPYPDFYERLRAGDPEMIEVALCFLEVRPYFFRSGYHWKTILQKCKSAPMLGEQAERFRDLLERYRKWRTLRQKASERGEEVSRELWPLLCRFYNLFPVQIPHHKYDGLVTAGDLYRILCDSLKVEALSSPDARFGEVRTPCRAVPGENMSAWASEYGAWRRKPWSPNDVWATLVSLIRDVNGLKSSFQISTETVLREASGPVISDESR